MASQVDNADVRQSVEHQLHRQRGEQETEHLLGHQHPAGIQLVADRGGKAEHLPGAARISGVRSDIRFAMDSDGELYILSKSDGMIRVVVNATAR